MSGLNSLATHEHGMCPGLHAPVSSSPVLSVQGAWAPTCAVHTADTQARGTQDRGTGNVQGDMVSSS